MEKLSKIPLGKGEKKKELGAQKQYVVLWGQYNSGAAM